MSTKENFQLKVCYFGTYRAGYVRNQIMIARLQSAGVEVVECHEPLWQNEDDRIHVASGGWSKPSFIWRVIKTYVKLILHYLKTSDHDIVIVGYPGQLDVLIAYLLCKLRAKPLVWDILMSLYLIAEERKLTEKSPVTANLLIKLEKIACQLPDLLIADTESYMNWFKKTHNINKKRFCLIPIGADDRLYQPLTFKNAKNQPFIVTYYGSFIPNHGVENIVQAAKLLEYIPEICFQLIGSGPDKENIIAKITQLQLKNITLFNWMEPSDLVQNLVTTDVLLGTFGTTPQALMTVQNKVFEALAVAKPVITGDSPAIREILVHGKHVYLVKRADPSDLSNAILYLKNNEKLRHLLSYNGYNLFQQKFTISNLGSKLKNDLLYLFHDQKK